MADTNESGRRADSLRSEERILAAAKQPLEHSPDAMRSDGAVATELTDHITDAETKKATEESYEEASIVAEDVAAVISFALGRPQRVSLNEILIRPTAQGL